MSKQVLIVQGGWEGHYPKEISDIFAGWLKDAGCGVTIADTLDAYKTTDLKSLDLIVPMWTTGTITGEQVAHGDGLGRVRALAQLRRGQVEGRARQGEAPEGNGRAILNAGHRRVEIRHDLAASRHRHVPLSVGAHGPAAGRRCPGGRTDPGVQRAAMASCRDGRSRSDGEWCARRDSNPGPHD